MKKAERELRKKFEEQYHTLIHMFVEEYNSKATKDDFLEYLKVYFRFMALRYFFKDELRELMLFLDLNQYLKYGDDTYEDIEKMYLERDRERYVLELEENDNAAA
jgi:hypothetical protein